MISKLNSFFCTLFDIFIYPVSSFSKEVQILYVSFISGIIFLLIYGKISNQKGIKETKRKVMAYVLEVALYRHSIKVCLKSQLNLLIQGAKYVSFALIPLCVLMVPCILIMAQLNLHYESRGLRYDEEAIVEVKAKDDIQLENFSLEGKYGVISPALRVDDDGKIFWKIKNNNKNRELKEVKFLLKEEDSQSSFPVYFDYNNAPLFSNFTQSKLLSFLYPSKFKFINDKVSVEELKIYYPSSYQYYFGKKINWLIVFLIVSILSGFLASKIFKIEI